MNQTQFKTSKLLDHVYKTGVNTFKQEPTMKVDVRTIAVHNLTFRFFVNHAITLIKTDSFCLLT